MLYYELEQGESKDTWEVYLIFGGRRLGRMGVVEGKTRKEAHEAAGERIAKNLTKFMDVLWR